MLRSWLRCHRLVVEDVQSPLACNDDVVVAVGIHVGDVQLHADRGDEVRRGVPARLVVFQLRQMVEGQDVPLETKIIEDVLKAEFNSPFEEIALVEELRNTAYGPDHIHIMLQKPLGIYVPPERLQLWQTGRSRQKIASKMVQHPGIELDILREYILIYNHREK